MDADLFMKARRNAVMIWPALKVNWSGRTARVGALVALCRSFAAPAMRRSVSGSTAARQGPRTRFRDVWTDAKATQVATVACWRKWPSLRAGTAQGQGGSRLRRRRARRALNTYVPRSSKCRMQGGFPRSNKIWCAVDCGVAVKPQRHAVRQIEAGAGYGLGSVLFRARSTLGEGGTSWNAFDTYRMAAAITRC